MRPSSPWRRIAARSLLRPRRRRRQEELAHSGDSNRADRLGAPRARAHPSSRCAPGSPSRRSIRSSGPGVTLRQACARAGWTPTIASREKLAPDPPGVRLRRDRPTDVGNRLRRLNAQRQPRRQISCGLPAFRSRAGRNGGVPSPRADLGARGEGVRLTPTQKVGRPQKTHTVQGLCDTVSFGL